ncbi:MAG: helix-turn-helix domain-containing protein [Bacteroidota bacterium]
MSWFSELMQSNENLVTGFFAGMIMMAFFHGVLLTSFFFFSDQLATRANKYLSLSIMGVCIILAYEFIYWLEIENHIPDWIHFLPLYIRTTIPVGLYYYVIFLIQPNHQLSIGEKAGFYIIGFEVLLDLIYIPVNLFVNSSEDILLIEYYIDTIGWFLGLSAASYFLPAALKKVNSYQNSLFQNYSTTSDKSLGWLRNFLIATFFVIVIGLISFLQYVLGLWDASEFTFTLITIGLMLLLFWIGYAIILKYNWFQIVPVPADEHTGETENTKLSSKTDKYHQNLLTLMQEQKLFEDAELTLDILAQHLEISSGYLSQIINEKENKNFFEFINTYRVEAVKEKLLNNQFQNYTIFGIAMECGFKSKSTFNSVFKKITGQTPSIFKKKAA